MDNSDDSSYNAKLLVKIMFIYKALENGWTVKKLSAPMNSFEFSKDVYESNRVKRSTSYPI